jgi:hypothetical protein
MGAAAVVLTVVSGTTEGSYTFVCPVCDDRVDKHADRKVVMLLLSAGVEVRERIENHPSQQTLDTAAPEGRPDGPPLTVDDLIDFHFLLEREDWLEDLLRSDA